MHHQSVRQRPPSISTVTLSLNHIARERNTVAVFELQREGNVISLAPCTATYCPYGEVVPPPAGRKRKHVTIITAIRYCVDASIGIPHTFSENISKMHLGSLHGVAPLLGSMETG